MWTRESNPSTLHKCQLDVRAITGFAKPAGYSSSRVGSRSEHVPLYFVPKWTRTFLGGVVLVTSTPAWTRKHSRKTPLNQARQLWKTVTIFSTKDPVKLIISRLHVQWNSAKVGATTKRNRGGCVHEKQTFNFHNLFSRIWSLSDSGACLPLLKQKEVWFQGLVSLVSVLMESDFFKEEFWEFCALSASC